MNISNLFNFSTFGSPNQTRTSSQGVAEMSPLAQAVQRADLRVQSEVCTNSAQMSSFGQLKSSLSQVQIAAHELSQLHTTHAPSVSQIALDKLLTTVHAALTTALATAALPGATQATQSASRVVTELQGITASNSPSAQALKSIGIDWHGMTLTVDASALSAAWATQPSDTQAVLQQFGQSVEQIATTELGVDGDVNGPLKLLNRQANTLQAQQFALASAAQATAAYAGHQAAYLTNIS